ncbi:LysR family transcriptional regulator [Chloroflexus sp. MS-CIW-1]|jgi:LysR family transcriptional activator of nhaA|uniref:LysR family transcriptional regulator n=1 Tax=unclassified Chloroflexus TaxID=2633855 RepID=UPI0004DF27F4|nr:MULTISPECIES: LysR family transcriptional regulator [unclassified Chloroflexus]MBO9349272.1 LysR family transcriptional regulator [Chloroflexus sp.]MDN5270778.1 LysR family transcriptional regulator [Chloroflexus sp. MS-CIW-1]
MLNYHHLRYFWIVAHEGNLTRAAQKYNIAQSALSMQINALEEFLGQPLFERVGRRLVLTEAGHIALDFADAIFAKGEELLATFGRLAESHQKTLRVGALATLSRNFQVGFLRPLFANPEIKVIVRSGTLEELLGSLKLYDLDVVLATGIPFSDQTTPWIVHVIDTQPVGLIGQPHPNRYRQTLAELLQSEPIIVPSPESTIRTGFDAFVHRLNIQPKIVAEIDDMAMLRLVVREHHALAVIPPIVVKDELETGMVVEYAELPDLVETFCAITLARRFPNPLLSLVLPKTAASEPGSSDLSLPT